MLKDENVAKSGEMCGKGETPVKQGGERGEDVVISVKTSRKEQKVRVEHS